ncbi:Uncharacterised protein [Mycobacteroides abscessus subsp. abscessus]|nr:Uncharacterised protein [Mycobacteroides abscessus subsp. abscessus]
MIGDLRDLHVIGLLGKHARDVECDVAVADDRNLLSLKRPVLAHIGVRVVPVDEVRGTVGTGEVDAGDVQRGIDEAAGGEDHGVVAIGELVQGDVDSVVDVGEHPDVSPVEDLDQGVDDALDPGVIRSHPVADQTERGWESLEEIDADLEITLSLRQQISRIDPSGTGTDNSHTERTGHSHTSLDNRGQFYRRCRYP